MWIQLLKPLLGRQAGERIHVSEDEAKGLIAQGLAAEVKDDPLAQTLTKGIEEVFGKVNKALEEQLDAAIKQFQQAQAKSRKNALPAIFGEGGNGDPKKTFGQFLIAIQQKDHKALEAMGSQFVQWGDGSAGTAKTAMGTQGGATGGFAIPTDFYRTLMALVTEQSIVRQYATLIPMATRTIQVPCLDVSTAPTAGDTALLGGLVGRWTEEAVTLNETEPALKQVELTNYELSGYSKLSNALLADNAVGLEAFLMQLFSKAIAWYEDYAFLRGNGVGKPLGVLSWGGFLGGTRSAATL